MARRAEPSVRWQEGHAERLPFPDGTFDRAVSQFAVMFFTDPARAIEEMVRVTLPGGRVAIAAWDGLDHNDTYARLAVLVEELFGPAAGGALRAPFALGDLATLDALGRPLQTAKVRRHAGVARIASLERWLYTEVRGWTLADAVDDAGLAALVERARDEFAPLIDGEAVVFPSVR